jgi:Uma2 family endonuclease
LLTSFSGEHWIVTTEFPFRPAPEFEIWSADVAVVSRQRWTATDQDEWFTGAPEIVIEVLSPSNSASEMLDREKTGLQGGCREFWVVDPDLRLVRVSRADGPTATYEPGYEIPLDLLGGGGLDVAAIFDTEAIGNTRPVPD